MPHLTSPFTILLGNLPVFVRLELTKLLRAQTDLQVTGVAGNATELVTMARRLRPGLVVIGEEQLLDLEQLARQYAVPVLIYSATTLLGGALREAARWHVYDVIKPLLPANDPGYSDWRRELLRKIRAAKPQLIAATQAVVARRAQVTALPNSIVLIGASTGGSAAVEALIRSFPASISCAVIIAVHLPAHFTLSLVERLSKVTTLPIAVAHTGTRLEAGKILVAPGGYNITVRPVSDSPWQAWETALTSEYVSGYDEPSINLLMQSAAATAGRKVLGVVLTGLGQDGTLGALSIRQHGGTVLAQNEATSAVFGMPKSVIEAGYANAVLPLSEIAEFIQRFSAALRLKRPLPISAPLHAA
ncbi:chemotaxis protein CheB [Hymenobacter jejuensis]|uniref:protein-glutamate methylesterase n=1 Tax=Hymenobacter jejuensis TaxID=2502781 RepID=A0A5B8A793_9BACT|nr:chemotaxis protein CheB [Hymenobacter jejuensis]QDA62322.1 chemotaxis protein CheB [Hymenobacter jejuensis]